MPALFTEPCSALSPWAGGYFVVRVPAVHERAECGGYTNLPPLPATVVELDQQSPLVDFTRDGFPFQATETLLPKGRFSKWRHIWGAESLPAGMGRTETPTSEK